MRIAISSESNTWNTWFDGKGIRCSHPRIEQSCTRTSIRVIVLACPVRIVFPHIGCVPHAVRVEWRIPWISLRMFAWFTRAFLSSLNNNYHAPTRVLSAGSYYVIYKFQPSLYGT